MSGEKSRHKLIFSLSGGISWASFPQKLPALLQRTYPWAISFAFKEYAEFIYASKKRRERYSALRG
jgi:hypothetical protein